MHSHGNNSSAFSPSSGVSRGATRSRSANPIKLLSIIVWYHQGASTFLSPICSGLLTKNKVEEKTMPVDNTSITPPMSSVKLPPMPIISVSTSSSKSDNHDVVMGTHTGTTATTAAAPQSLLFKGKDGDRLRQVYLGTENRAKLAAINEVLESEGISVETEKGGRPVIGYDVPSGVSGSPTGTATFLGARNRVRNVVKLVRSEKNCGARTDGTNREDGTSSRNNITMPPGGTLFVGMESGLFRDPHHDVLYNHDDQDSDASSDSECSQRMMNTGAVPQWYEECTCFVRYYLPDEDQRSSRFVEFHSSSDGYPMPESVCRHMETGNPHWQAMVELRTARLGLSAEEAQLDTGNSKCEKTKDTLGYYTNGERERAEMFRTAFRNCLLKLKNW